MLGKCLYLENIKTVSMMGKTTCDSDFSDVENCNEEVLVDIGSTETNDKDVDVTQKELGIPGSQAFKILNCMTSLLVLVSNFFTESINAYKCCQTLTTFSVNQWIVPSSLSVEKKHAAHALTATETLETETQKDRSAVDELSKQQILVQYLKDSLAFTTEMHSSIPVIALLLGSKNITDVLEAIELFDSMIGIRCMLPIIWSKEANIRDAVVTAYKLTDMGIVKSNVDVLVMEGLGPRADTDLLLARDTCLALLKLSTTKTIMALLWR
ncbi:meiotic chromosome condensation [Mactra antiquata]